MQKSGVHTWDEKTIPLVSAFPNPGWFRINYEDDEVLILFVKFKNRCFIIGTICVYSVFKVFAMV